MSTTKDGGPAFPYVLDATNGLQVFESGMTLRDYFAAQVAHAHATGIAAADLGTPEKWHAEVARLAYMTADAMLAEREKAAQP